MEPTPFGKFSNIRVPFRVPLYKGAVLYGGPKCIERDPNLENYPSEGQLAL